MILDLIFIVFIFGLFIMMIRALLLFIIGSFKYPKDTIDTIKGSVDSEGSWLHNIRRIFF